MAPAKNVGISLAQLPQLRVRKRFFGFLAACGGGAFEGDKVFLAPETPCSVNASLAEVV